MSTLFLDFKVAVRHLLKSPGFSTTAVLMLALGIGATTAIFSAVNPILFKALPYPEASRLAMPEQLPTPKSDPLPGNVAPVQR